MLLSMYISWLGSLSNPCIPPLKGLVKDPALEDAKEPEDETPLQPLSTEGAQGGSWPCGLVPTEHSFGKTSSKVTELRKRGRKQFNGSAPVKILQVTQETESRNLDAGRRQTMSCLIQGNPALLCNDKPSCCIRSQQLQGRSRVSLLACFTRGQQGTQQWLRFPGECTSNADIKGPTEEGFACRYTYQSFAHTHMPKVQTLHADIRLLVHTFPHFHPLPPRAQITEPGYLRAKHF